MRHGRTDWNDMHKLQGRTDIPLNDSGRQMARDAAVRYADVDLDIIYTSPLKRAAETAAIIAGDRDIPIIEDTRLVEMCFGIYEGVENSFKSPDCPVNVLFKTPEKYTVPVEGGESFDELFERTGAFLDEMVYPLLKEGKDILIIGHGAMNLSIINRIRNIPIKDYWSAGIENCKLLKLI